MNNIKLDRIKFEKFQNYSLEIRAYISFISALLCFINSNAQTLNDYLNEGAANNPELKALGYQYEIAKEKPNELGGLPNTRVGAGYFVSEPETRTGAQKARFSLQQELPWLGKTTANKNVVVAEIASEKNQLEIAKRNLALSIKTAYYNVYELRAKHLIIEAKKALLKNYHEIALTNLENNKTSAVTVLKITIAQNELDEQGEQLKGRLLNTEMVLNKLLFRDGFEALSIPEQLAIPEEEPTLALDEITYHPEIEQFNYLNTVVEQQTKRNAKERLPSLHLGLDYVIVEERPNLEFEENGKDIILPTVAFSIPIFSKKYNSKLKQYELEQERISYQRSQAENMLSQRLETAINNRITARIRYDTQQKNIKQTQQAEELLLTSYEAGLINFSEVLEVQKMALDFEFKKIAAVKDYFIQTAIINYML